MDSYTNNSANYKTEKKKKTKKTPDVQCYKHMFVVRELKDVHSMRLSPAGNTSSLWLLSTHVINIIIFNIIRLVRIGNFSHPINVLAIFKRTYLIYMYLVTYSL